MLLPGASCDGKAVFCLGLLPHAGRLLLRTYLTLLTRLTPLPLGPVNDDIQGTGAVVTSGFVNGMK